MFSNSKKTESSSVRVRNLRFESLETRELLSVAPSDYAIIRESYPTLNLPETFEEINIIEINAQDFANETLQQAFARASETNADDLIVLRSEVTGSVFDVGSTSVVVDVDSNAFGSISLVSYGGSGVSSIVSSSVDGAFNVVQGDFQLGGLLVVELGVEAIESSAVGLQTDQVAFICQTRGSSSENAAWSVDYEREGGERVFLTGLDQTQALALATTSTEQWFITNNYYDADKTRALDNDEHICWAAAASNILWYTGWGQITPFTDEQNLFESVFVNNFSDKAGSSYYGAKWFLTGEYPSDLDDTWSKPSSGGGYYQQAFKSEGESVDAYVSHSNFTTSPSKTSELADKLQSGYGISLSVEWYNKTTGVNENAHSIAVWGYSYDSSKRPNDYGFYTGLYFTDSDDYQSEERLMRFMPLTWHASCNVEGTYRGAYVLDGYAYNTSSTTAAAVITGATFLAQRPSKYASATDGKPNLYPSVVADGASLLLTTSSSSTKNSDTFLSGSNIYANFAFKSTKAVNKTVACQLWLDGTLYKTFSYKSLVADKSYGPGSTNISLGKLDVGSHTLRLVIDSGSVVDEYNENDNYFLRTFYVLESDAIFVTTNKDVVNDKDGVTSLREAILQAGTTGHGSTILFDSSLKGKTIELSSSSSYPSYLHVQRAITIDASTIWDEETNSPGITINAKGKSSAFCLEGGTSSKAVKLVGLKMINGSGLVPTNDSNTFGGAVYTRDYAEFIDCAFESNKASVGGAIYCYQGSLTVQNCVFSKNAVKASNSQDGLGGAIYLYEGSLKVSGGSFNENSSVSSGAIFSYNSQTTISGVSFVKNTATQYAGAAYFRLGTVEISDSFFNGNSASLYAGAVEFSEVTASVSQTVFTKSTSGAYGGAAYVYGGSSSFVNCEFRGNTAATYGGAVFLHGQNQHYFSNCALLDNRADSGIGDALFSQYYDGKSKTLLTTMRNCTIAGQSNKAIYLYDAQCGIKLYNSIVVGSSIPIDTNETSATVEGYKVLSTYADWTKSSQNLVYDPSKPLFTDADSGDYTLAFQSQALDVGLNKYALDPKGQTLEKDSLGASRVICETVDLGAYERLLESTPETPTNLTFGAYDASKKTIAITWNDNSDVEYNYLVESSTDGKEWKTLTKASADATSATLSKVALGASYFARVSATNRAGASQYAYASRYVPTIPTAPSDVSILKNNDKENATYAVLWNDKSSNESYFVVQVSEDGKNWTELTRTNANVASFESSEPLTRVRVAAGNGSGISSYAVGKTISTASTLETTAGSGLCLRLEGIDAETILWDFGAGVTQELKNGATIDPSEYGLTSGSSIITAQYVDDDGVTKKTTVGVRINEVSPSLRVEALPSVDVNAAVFRINANFAGRTVVQNWRVDWGDGTSTLYDSTSDFFIAKYYKPSKKTVNYEIAITLLDDSGSDLETFELGIFTSPAKASAAPTTMKTTDADVIVDRAFEEFDELEESLATIANTTANAETSVYGPLFLTDVFANYAEVDESLRKAWTKKTGAF